MYLVSQPRLYRAWRTVVWLIAAVGTVVVLMPGAVHG